MQQRQNLDIDMSIGIGGGITIGGGISIDVEAAPAASGIVTSGLTFDIDAANSSSYSGSGSTWYDLAGSADDVTLYNSPTFTSGPQSYFTFNGSSQYGATSTTNIIPTTQYTKMVWFLLNSYVPNNNLVSGSSGGHFMFFAASNRLYSGHANWSNYQVFGTVAVFSLYTWYCAALTFSTTNGMKIYINGALDNTYTANKSARGGNGSIEIGAFGGGNLLNGRISRVLCYDRELDSTEVLQNFNATKTSFGF